MARQVSDAGTPARITNLVLGTWLFISAFIWAHTAQSFTNTWVLGAIIAVASLVALAVPPVRYVNTAAAIWLFFSSIFWVPHVYLGTVWHNAILAIVVFVVSLVPSRKVAMGRGRAPVRREVHA